MFLEGLWLVPEKTQILSSLCLFFTVNPQLPGDAKLICKQSSVFFILWPLTVAFLSLQHSSLAFLWDEFESGFGNKN